MGELGLAMALLSALIWAGLLALWGQFWRCNQRLEEKSAESGVRSAEFKKNIPTPDTFPTVCAIIPARNEADMLPKTLRSLLLQDYPGEFHMIVVDDQSTDGTGTIAQAIAQELNVSERLTVISAKPLPPGWTGKLWAMEQGVQQAQTYDPVPDYFLLTDADIEHDLANLHQLVTKAQHDDLDLVSLMVLLRCQSVWEKLLIPAFVFFFQKLYPFPWVNHPNRSTAAAAGGCILMQRQALAGIGGLQSLRQALIDDCSLAQQVKRQASKEVRQPDRLPSGTSGKIWLGLTQTTRSLRPYDTLATIWEMVARTAYTQLGYSPFLLMGTVFGMTLIYLVAPIALFIGVFTQNWTLSITGLLGWILMAIAYLPTVRLYNLSFLWAVCLPAIAFLYNLMTIDSAIRHWRGQGGAWKGRVYPTEAN
ncbi:MAG: glycosyl transferase family 2 [Leptolyngbya sp.]|nr:MAG: glycosyl transferase family 2 [Leptolyngbya sp.]